MSQGLLLKKKEQHLQHQLLLQQQQQQQLSQMHSFPSPITPTYDKKVFSSPSSSTSSSSCRYDNIINGSSTSTVTEVSSSASLYSSPTSSTASTPSSSSKVDHSQRHNSSYGQYHFGDVYGSGGSFLSNSYATAALGSHHDLTRSSCSALPSPTIYPPTPPPSSTPWLHPAWFGSMETAAGYMKTPPKNNPFEN